MQVSAQFYDAFLTAIAAALATASAATTAVLFAHADETDAGRQRTVWTCVTAFVAGCGFWATQSVAAIAYASSSGSIVIETPLVVASLIVPAALTVTGALLALPRTRRLGRVLGGLIFAAAIPLAHLLALAAFGMSVHDSARIIADGVASVMFGAAAVAGATGRHGDRRQTTVLLTSALFACHLGPLITVGVAVGGTVIAPIPTGWLVFNIFAAFAVVMTSALVAVSVDLRYRRRNKMHADHMRGLANGAVEGLLLCLGKKIESVNDSFITLAGSSYEELVGRLLNDTFRDPIALHMVVNRPGTSIQTVLCRKDGGTIPVEMISKHLDINGEAHVIIAVRDLRQRQEAERHIRYLAMHDSLTGLPNRSMFNTRLENDIKDAAGTGREGAVVLIDLDGFKEVNDSHGHAAGDGVLKMVAQATTPLLPQGAMMARLGGDEFAVILPRATTSGAEDFAARTISAISAGNGFGVSASIGIAFYPSDGADREAVMRAADVAMYRAKEEGKSMWRRYDLKMGASARERRAIDHDLRLALQQGQFELVYQPQQCLRTDRITGFETLLRWKHPKRGYVAPDVFIPIAEENGLIVTIGEWTLRQACREAASWTTPLTIAVNVSAVQLYKPDFDADLRQILAETGLPAERLELEITETAMIKDLQRAVATLRRIKTLGIRIAMDDFGTGYSSLSNLRAFPFDKIKLDKSFITAVTINEQSATIIRAVLGIGRGLGLPVIAEGVETEAQAAFLRTENCDEMQGYLIGRPAPIDTFAALVRAPEQVEPRRAA